MWDPMEDGGARDDGTERETDWREAGLGLGGEN